MDMATKYSIWNSAYSSYCNQDYETALKIYKSMDHLPQVLFNMASILIKMNNYKEAADCLTKALTIDKKFAIAFYQRGFCFFSMDKFQTAAADFSTARKLLKTKKVVDYSPAGLEAKLFMCELMYNAAQCYFKLDQVQKAEVLLSLAKKFVMSKSQASVLQSSTQHIYSVESGLQFIPELKLKTVGSTPRSMYKDVLIKLPQKAQTFGRLRSSSESAVNKKDHPTSPQKAQTFGRLRSSSESASNKEDHLTPESQQDSRTSKSKSLFLTHLSTGAFLESWELGSSPFFSVVKINSPEGNLMICLEPDNSLADLKEKVLCKLQNMGANHYKDISLTQNGFTLRTNDDLQDLLLKEELVLLKVEKDVVDFYLDL